MQTSIAPWLSVRGGAKALAFYKAAFGATEVFVLNSPDDSIVARLSVDGAGFWFSDESPAFSNPSPETIGGSPVRMILSVPDPDAVFAQALNAGAVQVCPMKDDHGWRVGRVVDPFGHHWEIARKLTTA
jgi:PhnB protein